MGTKKCMWCCDRIKDMRQKLRDSLEAKLPGRSFEYITKQNGNSYTGLTLSK